MALTIANFRFPGNGHLGFANSKVTRVSCFSSDFGIFHGVKRISRYIFMRNQNLWYASL